MSSGVSSFTPYGFPHIMDNILDELPFETLLSFRATSRDYRDYVDTRLFRHVMFTTPPAFNALMHEWGLSDKDQPPHLTYMHTIFRLFKSWWPSCMGHFGCIVPHHPPLPGEANTLPRVEKSRIASDREPAFYRRHFELRRGEYPYQRLPYTQDEGDGGQQKDEEEHGRQEDEEEHGRQEDEEEDRRQEDNDKRRARESETSQKRILALVRVVDMCVPFTFEFDTEVLHDLCRVQVTRHVPSLAVEEGLLLQYMSPKARREGADPVYAVSEAEDAESEADDPAHEDAESKADDPAHEDAVSEAEDAESKADDPAHEDPVSEAEDAESKADDPAPDRTALLGMFAREPCRAFFGPNRLRAGMYIESIDLTSNDVGSAYTRLIAEPTLASHHVSHVTWDVECVPHDFYKIGRMVRRAKVLKIDIVLRLRGSEPVLAEKGRICCTAIVQGLLDATRDVLSWGGTANIVGLETVPPLLLAAEASYSYLCACWPSYCPLTPEYVESVREALGCPAARGHLLWKIAKRAALRWTECCDGGRVCCMCCRSCRGRREMTEEEVQRALERLNFITVDEWWAGLPTGLCTAVEPVVLEKKPEGFHFRVVDPDHQVDTSEEDVWDDDEDEDNEVVSDEEDEEYKGENDEDDEYKGENDEDNEVGLGLKAP